MNRITSATLGNLNSDSDANSTDTNNLSATATLTRYPSGHAFFAPLHYEKRYAYPLVVWLHGAGGSEQQLRKVMGLISLRNYVGVAPRGTVEIESENAAQTTYRWSQRDEHILLAGNRVLDAIDLAKQRFNLNPRRVFLAGMDCGGTMAFRIAMRFPERFAGVLSLGGAFPAGKSPFARLSEARRLPLFVACGRESKAYSPLQVCDDLRLWHTAGMSVTLRQYPCGDEITADMFADMDRWMMEQVVPSSTTSCDKEASRLDSQN